jgi:hypothetical protein
MNDRVSGSPGGAEEVACLDEADRRAAIHGNLLELLLRTVPVTYPSAVEGEERRRSGLGSGNRCHFESIGRSAKELRLTAFFENEDQPVTVG